MTVLALFGGSFDPVHAGHRAVAEAAWATGQIDRLHWIPARQPPHKPHRTLARDEDRLALLRIAVEGRSEEAVDDRELQREGPSYSIDTIEAVAADFPAAALVWLAGVDTLSHLASWHRVEDLLERIELWLAPRPHWTAADTARSLSAMPQNLRDRLRLRELSMEPVDASSTAVRNRIEAGEDWSDLVPAAIAWEIVVRQLYRDPRRF